MAYGSASGVRLVNFKITSTLMDDTAVLAVLTVDIDPQINAYLGVSFTTAPALIVSCSNELGAAEIAERHLLQDDEESGWAKRIRDKWWGTRDHKGMLQMIKSGEMTLTDGDGYAGVAAMSSSDPTEDEPSYRVFVNDETDWQREEISREVST